VVSVACRRYPSLRPASKRGLTPLLIFGLRLFAGCDAELYHDLSERRANEALLALREVGLRADKREQRGLSGRPGGFALVVPRAEESRALYVLEKRGLPRLPERPTSGNSRLLPSPDVVRSEQAAALSSSLADTLERLPEVAEARVHLALPEPEPLSPLGSLRPTASVLLRLRAPLSVKPVEVAEIIARSVPGLDPQDVAVVRAPFLPDKAGPGSGLELPPLVAVGPLRLTPESRPLALFFGGLLVLLTIACAVLVRIAWTRRTSPASPLEIKPR
jgi:type III secretion protein J